MTNKQWKAVLAERRKLSPAQRLERLAQFSWLSLDIALGYIEGGQPERSLSWLRNLQRFAGADLRDARKLKLGEGRR